MFLNDCKEDHGYFAIGVQQSFEVGVNAPVDFKALDEFIAIKDAWKFGFISYDLKNDVEALNSNNQDGLTFPKIHFFIPQNLLLYKDGEFSLIYGEEKYLEEVKLFSKELHLGSQKLKLNPRITQVEYLKSVKRLQNEIRLGNIYEINFCYEFYKENTSINPIALYNRLVPYTKAPFSAIGKFKDRYIISASPERFIKKEGAKVVSQPIKGTIGRGETKEEDLELKKQLKENPKERSENIMIVDLVRNDLSQIGRFDSVKVEELCEVYSFESVHQMISTVSCQLEERVRFSDVLKATFPMGSMTGAPKVRAMELIEDEEKTKRGVYSGAVGYIKPNGDFDFNVVIRSFLYHSTQQYLSAMVGGAITAKSDPIKEYEETLVKINPLLKAISQ
ncbi:MAG: anthranilate synthase component I family protein [Flavobacteriales bacterium]|nr:anthranilate synthase component I family protein [Flavobacteriales bacterium]